MAGRCPEVGREVPRGWQGATVTSRLQRKGQEEAVSLEPWGEVLAELDYRTQRSWIHRGQVASALSRQRC